MSDRLLIIEDNAQNLYLMRFLLEKNGFTVLGAENGAEGIRMALHHKPQASCWTSTARDGWLCRSRELKKHSELAGIPIVAVTSYAMVGDREHVLAAGATGYIEKPINPETFVSEIRSFLPPEPNPPEKSPR
jgi:CheY-like chemotaxis protein